MNSPIESREVSARSGAAFKLRVGDRLKVISPHGGQVADLFAFNADDATEYLSMRHTVASGTRNIYPRQGDIFLTSRRRPIIQFVEDGANGQHEMILAACDPMRYRLLGVQGYHASCAENLQQAMATRSIAIAEIPQPLNLFSSSRVDADGNVITYSNSTRPGDYAIFEALMDAIVVVSACPFDIESKFPVNVGGTKPVQVEVYGRARDQW